MRYQTKKVITEAEVIELTKNEYDRVNDFYKEALLNDGVPFPVIKNTNLNKMILTNGIYRKEFMVQISENVNIDRETDAKERHEYLEELEENQTDAEKEYAKIMNNDNVRNPLKDILK